MSRIAIDLTPLLPGGENGAAKLLALELMDQFKKLVHPHNFLLLTAYWNHQELASFDGPRFERFCVLHKEISPNEPNSISAVDRLKQLGHRLRQAMPQSLAFLLSPLVRKLKQHWIKLVTPPTPSKTSNGLLCNREVDLLFCPFTAPIYAEPGTPVVSIFYDLQHHAYPQFFTSHELETRDATLDHVRRQVEAIICISEFSRQALLTDFNIEPERTFTIPVCIHSRLCETTPALSILEKSGLKDRPYFFYPANYWPHKNHQMLLTAYNILLKRNPGLELDLVFTGALDQSEKKLRTAVEIMGLIKRVHFLGYLSDEELAAVFQGCQFLIFPSLYEGFGVPLLEAFTFRKPVLCSQVGSLPEIGGKAAYYFDPRKPSAIVKTIEQLINNPDRAAELIRQGNERVSRFSKGEMARRYLEVFDRTLHKVTNLTEDLDLTGTFADGLVGSGCKN